MLPVGGAFALLIAFSSCNANDSGFSKSSAPVDETSAATDGPPSDEANDQTDLAPDSFTEEWVANANQSSPLSHAKNVLIGQAQYLFNPTANETFDESLRNTIDYVSNYFLIVHNDADSRPYLPDNFHAILLSRRWIRLVTDMQADSEGVLGKDVLRQLKSDLPKYRNVVDSEIKKRQVVSEGVGIAHIMGGPNVDSEKHLYPLGARVNVSLLLLGQFPQPEALGPILELARFPAPELTNWAAVGYAADKTMQNMDSDKVSNAKREVLEEYRSWKQTLPNDNAFSSYKKIQMPAYASEHQPGDPTATRIGKSDVISFEKPPIYDVAQSPSDDTATGFWQNEMGGNNNDTAKQIIEFAQRLEDAH
jgi:hypothetical protein